MIHYQLRCDAGHEFDGWFRDSAGFEAQAGAGLVACPQCGLTKVRRALMTPRIPRKGREVVDVPGGEPPPPPVPAAAGGVLPDAVRAALHKLRDEVESHCDYVGSDFAEEARRIHYGEAEALEEEGITFARIPWAPRNDG